MARSRVALSGLAVVVALGVSGAQAADYPPPYQPPPQPIIIQQPPVADFSEGWYLRGHVGIGMVSHSQLRPAGAALAGSDFAIEHSGLTDAYFVGAGVGYEWNNWLRLEASAEYRSKMKLDAFGSYTAFCPGGGICLDQYNASLKSYVFLLSAFVDLGTWNCFTPFVGLGVGGAYNQFTELSDVNVTTGGRGFGRDTGKFNFAWAAYAGVAYNVTKTFKVELTYRYLDLGSFSDTIDCVGGCGGPPVSYHTNVRSHDFMLGFRWACCDFTPPPPPVVYTPPPPIRSKG